MRFQTPLVPARLIRRYKRFLADIELETPFNGETRVTAHCANPGSMMGLADPGSRIWVEPNDDPKKKLNFGWRLVDHENGHFTGVDTSVPNRALRSALFDHNVPGLVDYDVDYDQVLPEQKYGENSRIDFLLRQTRAATAPGTVISSDTYVEVKSVTLSRTPGLAEFPDSVTARGTKHMHELASMARAGHRAIVLYLVQRTDAQAVTLAQDIDPTYAAALIGAMQDGVQVMAIATTISPTAIEIGEPLPFSP